MPHRTIGVDLAIRGDHVAQFFEDGRPVGPPLRFRHDQASLDAFVARASAGLGDADSVPRRRIGLRMRASRSRAYGSAVQVSAAQLGYLLKEHRLAQSALDAAAGEGGRITRIALLLLGIDGASW